MAIQVDNKRFDCFRTRTRGNDKRAPPTFQRWSRALVESQLL
jgi:hypothetical protein